MPTGGQFAAGQGAIAGSGNNLTINQSSSHGIIDWQSFSIGTPNSVQFNNGSGATLNRVTGGNLSRIDGSLSATGSVYLINPQGVVVGPGGKIVTNGSFVASTRDIPNGQFMAGGAMTASGTSNGDVVNAGTITSKTGDAILVGRSVVNSGTINAPEGQADLAAGNEIILQPVNSNSHIAISGGKGDVTNTGTVKAAQAALDSAGGNVYALVQNNGGIISATGTTTIDGHVWLTAGGSTTVLGTVSAKNADGSGGKVTVRSQEVSISGSVDASAMQAQKNGGDVSVIAKDQTVVTGTIKARGDAGGQGGAIETSGGSLDIGGAKIDAGEGGHWLLDPYDLTVDSAAATTISTSLDGGTDVTLQTTATGTSGPGNADASGSGDINIASAIGWSSGAKLTLDAYHSIFVNAPITLTGDGGVVLKTNHGGSGGVYDFGLTDSGFTGNIDFGPSDLGGTLSINGTTYSLLYTMGDVAGINGGSGHYALATTIDASSAGTYSSAVAATLPGTLTGLGNSISNLTINDTSGNNNLGLIGDLSGTVRDLALTDAHVTSGDGAFAGTVAGTSTGTIKNVMASGNVSGGDASDSRFAIVGGLIGNVNGGSIADAITAVTVTQGDASSSKASYAGGIAGRLLAASITGSHASSDVIGGAGNDSQVSYSGGLVGQANGASTITDSYASGAISGGFHTYLGGLAGDDGGTVIGSYATGAVAATASEQESRVLAGGLVGYAHGTINGSYATGNVTAPDTSRAGGLAGYSSGTISDSYASGAVSTGDAGMSGGLVGFASGGTITGSHASGAVETGDAIVTYGPTVVTNSYAGGFIGYVNTAATAITLSYATGATTGGATSYVGGFAGLNNGSITQSYATGSATTGDGPLTFLAIAGGFVGYNSSNGSIAEDFSIGAVSSTCVGNTACASVILEGLVGKNISTASAIKQSYFDSETSGQTTVGADFKLDNVVELTTAELQSGLPSGFNGGGNGRPTDSWAIVPGATFPYLAAQFSGTPQVISGTAYTDGGASVATSGTVSLLADGADLGAASIGTNGYYYALEDQDTVQISTALLASTTYIAGSRLETGASALDSNGNVSGFDIWGGTLIAPTSETTYSDASATTLQVQDVALIAAAVGGNTDPTTGLADYGYIASGDFTVDQSLTLSNGLYIESAGDIAVSNALTLPDAEGLTLDAAGALTITAPVTVSGAGAVSLAYDDSDPANLSFGLSGFSFAGSIDYATTSGTLSINGVSYTLLHDMSELAAINTDTGLQGNYALASSFDASSTSGWTPLGSDGSGNLLNSDNGFTGNLEGLGHAISNLTVDSGTNGGGLFAVIGDDGISAYGTVRDLAVANATISNAEYAGVLTADNYGDIVYVAVSGTITGDSSADTLGGLAATNLDYGLIENSVADVAINAGTGSDVYVGGLVGYNDNEIYGSYATGNVTALGDGATVGGLVGESDYSIEDSYATGSVTTGDGGPRAGGLVGYNNDGSITGSYATGNVTGGDSGTYDTEIGGLVGFNVGLIQQSYATGLVTAGDGGAGAGGLVGVNIDGFITQSYASGSVLAGDGGADVGGLVGYNGSSGTVSGPIGIYESYATGSVTGGNDGAWVGGLVGENEANIQNSYAMGAVHAGTSTGSETATVGGLVGYNDADGSVSDSYATGAVSGSQAGGTSIDSTTTGVANNNQYVGGLVGYDGVSGIFPIITIGSITNSYWDTETTGQSDGLGGGDIFGPTSIIGGLTTAELQGTLSNTVLSSTTWGTGTDLYPYFLWQYSTTPQAVSGTAYSDSGVTPLASGSTIYSVSALADGDDLGSATTGANGYYYILLPSGTVTSSTTAVLASSDGSNSGSRLDTGVDALDSNGNVSGFDIWGATLIAPTSETTYSTASATTLQVQDAALIATAVGGYTDPTIGLSNYGYIASGDFTIDQSLALSNGLYIKSAGDIAVPYALTLPTANGLTLDGAGTLSITAPITVSGAGVVSLAYDDSDPVNLSFGLTSQGFTGSIDFTGGSGSGASLAVNDTAYTLLYSLSDLAGINSDSGLQGDYALAVSLDASSLSNWTSLGTDGASNRYNSNNGFSGSFTGLGHTISDLTVDAGSAAFVGLFGYSKGTLRDVGVVGGTTTGDAYTGGLVGYSGGPVISTYATGAVNGSGYTGGLAGAAYGTVTNSYATGTVTATSEDTGGLIGFSIAAVSNSYATGAVNGEDFTGGLIGEVYAAVTNVYATGAVSGRDYVGGLIGDVYAAVTNAYATGVVSARNHVGGLIGSRHATVTNGYWDTETGGLSTSAGGTGLTTAVFQADSLTTLGFDSSEWSTDDGLYPYLTWQYPNGARAVSGIAYSDAGVTSLASGAAGAITVSALADGAALGSATTGANGYYYLLVPNDTLSGSRQLLTYLDGASTTANTYVADAAGNTSADLYGGWVRMNSNASTASAMFTGLSTALGSNSGSNFLYTSGSGLVSGASLGIVSGNTGGLVIDTALDVGAETISLDAAGPVTQSTPVTAGNLVLLGSGANYALTSGTNAVGTLAADTGAINFASDTDLTIGTVLTTAGITSTGAVTLTANGDITIDKSIENSGGDDIVLAAGQNFVNNAGSSALTTSGRWLVYSAAPGSDTFNGLDSGNTAIWNATFVTLPPASVTQSGNRYLFATQPTLTVTTTDVNKTYGDDATSAVAAAYTISGYESGVVGVYLGDTASNVYSGTPSVTSAGSATTADVPGSPYAITATAGLMDLLNGYALNFVNSGALTVDPASLSITADDVGATSLANVQLTSSYSGFINGETSAVVSGLQYGLFPVAGNSLQYDIVPFGASAANYTISYYGGLLTIAQPSAPIINNQGNGSTNIGTQSSSDFTLSGNFGAFSFNDVTTASIGGSDSVALLFQVGLPGTVSPFDAIALNNYSNATDSDDRLLCPSGRVSGSNTSCMGAGGP